MDKLTRKPSLEGNPAALLAAAWYYATDGRGAKDMVVLPYKDRLLLFSRYLQQLVMESLGIKIERQHHEVATAGQAEIDFRFDTLVKTADTMMLYKYIVKNTARSKNV